MRPELPKGLQRAQEESWGSASDQLSFSHRYIPELDRLTSDLTQAKVILAQRAAERANSGVDQEVERLARELEEHILASDPNAEGAHAPSEKGARSMTDFAKP